MLGERWRERSRDADDPKQVGLKLIVNLRERRP